MKVKFTIYERGGRVFHKTFDRDVELVVGRSPEADIHVRDPLISRRHCSIVVASGRVFVTDLGSSNGVVFKGRKITDAELKNSDAFGIGKSRVSVAIGGRIEEKSTIHLKPARKIDSLVGRTVGGNRLEKLLGEGACGEVYLAHQLSIRRPVALKILKTGLHGDDKTLKKFLREARSCAELNHPNIVHVYNMGAEKGLHYIVMEYVEGDTALEIIEKNGRMDPTDVAAYGLQLARALDYAYRKKIVHRDIKPANITVTDKGEAKLMDFGLAKNFEESGGTAITNPGEGLGTPNYMPPEQVDSAVAADQRSDIYSLGASLYHMLTGRFPHEDSTFHGMIKKILSEDPVPIKKYAPRTPGYLVKTVEKCMKKDPKKRYQVPEELIDDLTNALQKLQKRTRG